MNGDAGFQDRTYDALDDGVGHLVGVEELGLFLAAVGSLSVPPAGSIAVESGTSAIDSDGVTGDGDEGTGPLLVAEGGSALEDDVGTLGEVGQVEGGAGRDGNVVEGDGGARLLVLDSIGGVGESAAVALGGSSDDRGGSQCHGGEGSEEMHVKRLNE